MNDSNAYLNSVFGLKDQVIIVTGAAGGIGEALSDGISRAGAHVAMCDVRKDKNEKLAARLQADGLSAEAFSLDITDSRDMDNCIADIMNKWHKIDGLVNCAGINIRENILNVTPEHFDKIMDVNLKGLYFFTQKIVPYMIENGHGKIVNFSSHNAQGMLGGVSVYGATKSAVSALTRSMAIEWAQYNIQANAIAPGHILTELTQPTWTDPQRSAYLRERISMERPGDPDELIGMVIMLCSRASSYMTGQTYHVDGGCLAGGKPWVI